MPASSTGGLPVRRVNAVETSSPCAVRTTRGAKRDQSCVRAGSAPGSASVTRDCAPAASTMPTPVPCALFANSLVSVVPGPRSTTHRLRGLFSVSRSCTCADQSTWLSSTSAASSRACSALMPHAAAHCPTSSTARSMSGLWNGSVTSRYSSVGSNTRPPRTLSARSCAWCACSLPTSTANDARSCGWPESTTWSIALITATAIGPRASFTRAMSSSACRGMMPFTESIGVASP